MREKRHIDAMSADKQEAFIAIEDFNWHMQYEESIYNCAVVRIDLSSQQ
jgi:hypothetical protein